MLDKEPSGAPADPNLLSQPAGAAPGGPVPEDKPPATTPIDSSIPTRQFTLQFLIAAIKKTRN